MTRYALILLLCLVPFASYGGDTLILHGPISGSTLLDFSPTYVRGAFDGTAQCSGALHVEGIPVEFTVDGGFEGEVWGELNTLYGELHSGIDLAGTTSTGEPIGITGAFSMQSDDASYLLGGSAGSGSATGPVTLYITYLGHLFRVDGEIVGTLTVGYLPTLPEAPASMHMSATGSMSITGARIAVLTDTEAVEENADGPMDESWDEQLVDSIAAKVAAFFETDTDGDGIADLLDNCVLEANPDQEDGDGDGIGDACDDTYDEVVLADVISQTEDGSIRVRTVVCRSQNTDKYAYTLTYVAGDGRAESLFAPVQAIDTILVRTSAPAGWAWESRSPEHDGLLWGWTNGQTSPQQGASETFVLVVESPSEMGLVSAVIRLCGQTASLTVDAVVPVAVSSPE